MKGGVYVIRTRKPHALLGLPIIGRHTGYVGETSSFRHRKAQHLVGGGAYGAVAKCWADLEPRFIPLIPLPNWRWLRRVVEGLLIVTLCPAYNVKGQAPWNIRRIRPAAAQRQRAARNTLGPVARLIPLAVRAAVWLTLAGVAFLVVTR